MIGLLTQNKDVHMTVSVAYGWAGAVMEVNWRFGGFLRCVTDGPMDGPTDRLTDGQTDGRMDGQTDPGPT